MRQVVFLSHTASRTGAPLILLHLVRAARARLDLSSRVVLAEDGPLTAQFRATVPTLVLSDPLRAGTVTEPRESLHWWLDGASLVYANSAFSHDLLAGMPLGCPLMSHIHELEMGLAGRTVKVPGAVKQRFIAVSEAVRSNLVRRHSVAPDDVSLSYGFAPRARTVPDDARPSATLVPAVVHPRPMVVGSVGTLWPYKGPDLFVRLCEQVISDLDGEGANVLFVWVGGAHDGQEWERLRRLISDAGLTRSIRFIPEVDDARPYIRQFDVFVSTAREDPFPLVVLEAAEEGKPIVTFDSGGAVEFTRGTAGIVVPKYDIRLMGRQIIDLLQDAARRTGYGAAAAARARPYFGAEAGVARLIQLIDDFA